MVEMPELVRRSRRAYEIGRLWYGARALPILLLVAGAALLRGAPVATCVIAAAVSIAAVVTRWRGGVAGAGVVPGLLAGAAASVIVFAMGACGVECQTGRAFAGLCAGAGVAAGVALALALQRAGRMSVGRALGAAVFAGSTAMIGCTPLGVGYALGVAAAAAVGGVAVPLFATR
jgi:hypothetical protein